VRRAWRDANERAKALRIRQIGKSSLLLAHTNRSENAEQKPFGSTFWHNGARQTSPRSPTWRRPCRCGKSRVAVSRGPLKLHELAEELGASPDAIDRTVRRPDKLFIKMTGKPLELKKRAVRFCPENAFREVDRRVPERVGVPRRHRRSGTCRSTRCPRADATAAD
jgi:hypothetical protein